MHATFPSQSKLINGVEVPFVLEDTTYPLIKMFNETLLEDVQQYSPRTEILKEETQAMMVVENAFSQLMGAIQLNKQRIVATTLELHRFFTFYCLKFIYSSQGRSL